MFRFTRVVQIVFLFRKKNWNAFHEKRKREKEISDFLLTDEKENPFWFLFNKSV